MVGVGTVFFLLNQHPLPYVDGYANYVEKCNKISEKNYEGFILK